MTVTIRPLTQLDRTVWEELFEAYAKFYKTTVPDGGFDTVWDWIFDEDNEFWCDVALANEGTVIGFTQYQLMHRSLGGGMVCYLSDLYVRPEVRGSGAGRALIDHVVAEARAKGLINVRWLTQEFNYPARQLYDTYQPRSDFILYSIPV
ncbi:MAG: GNAT family N-acetyltransferase [Pseudomonadota bacterium]